MKVSKDLVSLKRIRLTGVLYLLVIIFAGFAQGVVRESLIVPDQAAATANNILEHKLLFRLGLTADLIAFMLDAVIAILLYKIFKPFDKNVALISSVFRLIAHPAIGSLNLLNHYMALNVLENTNLIEVSGTTFVNQQAYLFLQAHDYGYLIAGSFFGMHCLLLALLILRSDVFPKLFGLLLIGSATGYFIETFVNFNFPGHESLTALIVGISAAIGEVGLTLYMLTKVASSSYRLKQSTEIKI